MSRIGKKKIPLPQGVSIIQEGLNVMVKGPRGSLFVLLHPSITVRIDPDGVQVEKKIDHRKADALSGLTRSLIANMVKGVSEGFARQLEIVGVGYRAELAGKELVFQLGYSHRIPFHLPEGISAEVPKPTQVILRGIDKALLGQTAAKIRALRRPEPYKGKGVKYAEEKIRRKAGKTGAK